MIWLGVGALGTLAATRLVGASRRTAANGNPLVLMERCDDLSRQLQARLRQRPAA